MWSNTMSTPRPSVTSRANAATSAVRLLQTKSHPIVSARSHFSSVPAVAITVAPRCFASWIAATPVPEPAAWIITVSPAVELADLEQRVPHRQIASGKRRRRLERNRRRHVMDVRLGHEALLGVTAVDGRADDEQLAVDVAATGELRARAARRRARGRRPPDRRPRTARPRQPIESTVPATSMPAMCGKRKPGIVNQPLRCTMSR